MEKYGFVYQWTDYKRKMYYIGCHWGREDDGYICSSKSLRMAMLKSKRKGDFDERFKREILKTGIEKESLLIEEYKFLKEIPKEELGIKYYNLKNYLFPNNIGNHVNKGIPKSEQHKEKLKGINNHFFGKQHSEESKQKISNKLKGKIPWNRGLLGRRWFTDGCKDILCFIEKAPKTFYLGRTFENVISNRKGKIHSEESKQKMRKSQKELHGTQIECPHCGKIGGKTNMKRYHFDNCKSK